MRRAVPMTFSFSIASSIASLSLRPPCLPDTETHAD
jgi:hypothetical protein